MISMSTGKAVLPSAVSRIITHICLFRTILYNPFVPFIVVFCHVIETGDPQDLLQLEAFVRSLEAAKEYSDATAKMYHQSKVLYEAAVQYKELVASKSMDYRDSSLHEFDAYIQDLGMAPLGLLGNPGSELLFHDMDKAQGSECTLAWPL